MRQLIVEVQRESGDKAYRTLSEHHAMNVVRIDAERSSGPSTLIIAYVPNKKVEDLIDDLQELEDLCINLNPSGYIPLKPPASEAPDQVKDVSPRSPIEIFLSGLQSIGSWKGFLTYAVSAGIVVWIGLYTNTVYLLIAAMLIAPYAGPAMNAAVATARGDWILLRQSVIRYFSSLGVSVAVASILSLVMQQKVATNLMVDVSQVSSITMLLALTAGAAGASNLVQSERNSLVSGAAVGMLVAASLAPPAGVVGMSLVLGRWEMVLSGLFLLLLQLVGINLSGAIVFRIYGLTPKGVRYERGKRWQSRLFFSLSLIIFVGLVVVQFWNEPTLQRTTISQRAEHVIRSTIEKSDMVQVVEADARFTRAQIQGQNTLLCIVYVQRTGNVDLSIEQIQSSLIPAIQKSIQEKGWNITPIINLIVLDPPI